MAKRKLVEVNPAHHRQFEAMRKMCKQRGEPVPTIPYLLRVAVDNGMKATVDRFLNHWKSNK